MCFFCQFRKNNSRERKEPEVKRGRHSQNEGDIPQPVWAAAFGLAQTSCVAGLAMSSFRNFQPAWV